MPPFPYRMRDLVRLTGVSAATIHFYQQQGLLPESQKTAGNQAAYPESTVRRLLWIRAMQNELRLTLRGIGAILERWGELPIEEMRALQALGGLLEEPDPAAPHADLTEIRERLTPKDLDALAQLGLIAGSGGLSSSDVHLLGLVAAMRAAGFTDESGFEIESIALYRDAVDRLVTEELARIIEPVLSRHDAATLRDLVRRGLPLADQLLSLLHHRAVQQAVQQWLASDGNEQADSA